MKIDGAWLRTPATQAVCAAIAANGAHILFVGGCLRNALLGESVVDLDLATDARPETVVALAEAAGLKAVPTGIDHGTITVVSDRIPHEITTFRKDVETDGRHAVVAFSDRVEEDAARRDFTMNAIYAEADGTVVDPLGGLPDLCARHVRFIGEAEDRIREDYLRSLRYFRFFAWYGAIQDGPDPDALAAISATLGGLESLSKERVGGEILKLLAAPDPAPTVSHMRSTGVLNALLPGAEDQALAPLVHIEAAAGLAPKPMRRLACLVGVEIDSALRLSRSDARELARLADGMASLAGPGELGYRLGLDTALDVLALRAAIASQPWSPDWTERAGFGARQTCPVTAGDLMPGVSGPDLGRALKNLEQRWITSGFRLTKENLLSGGDESNLLG